MKTLLFASTVLASTSLFAGHAVVTGVGRVPAKPDYVHLTIDVNAECYKTPKAASEAADKIALMITNYLETQIDRALHDDVIANGGYTQPFSRFTTLPNGETKKTCIGTFQKKSTITLKKADVAKFPELFDHIQAFVYGQFQVSGNDDAEAAFATIGTPTTQLFHETQASLERVSQGEAVQNAIAKFESMFLADCDISGYSIVEYSEPNRYAREMPYERAQESFSAGGSSAPLSFDSHWVNTAVSVKFEFHGGHCAKKPLKE